MTEKPPYRILDVAEIHALPRNGLTVISTFSGAGGSCLGFAWAGYQTVAACEFVEAARDTYRANFPGVPIYEGDVRGVSGDELLALAGVDSVDVLEGSPPCSSFSTAGKRSAHWGQVRSYSDTEQRTDDLFDEYLRLVGEIRPRAFVAENVAGLVKGVSKGYFREVIASARAKGYRVGARVLDAQWLGVPQRRTRVIIVGFRDDLDLEPVFPDPLPYRYTIRDALPWLDGAATRDGRRLDGDDPAPTVQTHGRLATRSELAAIGPELETTGHRAGTRTQHSLDLPSAAVTSGGMGNLRAGQVLISDEDIALNYGPKNRRSASFDDPAPTVMARGIGGVREYQATVPDGDGPSLDGYAVGAEYDRLAPGESSDKYMNLVRPDADEPCPTVTQLGGHSPGIASVAHPTERRKFTIAELRRICGFPDDFVLTGTYAQQWERCGRAVPPPMMHAVAAKVAEMLA